MLGAFSVAYPTATSQGKHNSCGLFGSGLLLLYPKKLQIPRGQFECFLSRCRRDVMMSVLVTRLTAADRILKGKIYRGVRRFKDQGSTCAGHGTWL